MNERPISLAKCYRAFLADILVDEQRRMATELPLIYHSRSKWMTPSLEKVQYSLDIFSLVFSAKSIWNSCRTFGSVFLHIIVFSF